MVSPTEFAGGSPVQAFVSRARLALLFRRAEPFFESVVRSNRAKRGQIIRNP